MTRLILPLTLVAACATPQPEPAPTEEKIVEESPSIAEVDERGEQPTADLRYTLELVGEDPVLRVRVAFQGDQDGETELRSASRFGPLPDIPRYLQDVTATAGDGELEVRSEHPGTWFVEHEPSAALEVTWRVATRKATDRDAKSRWAFYVPFLDVTGMHVFGLVTFIYPVRAEQPTATIAWRGFDERGWKYASGAGPDPSHIVPLSVARRSVYVAGPNLSVVDRDVPGGLVRVALLGEQWEFDAQASADLLETIAVAQRDYFGDESVPYYFVSVLQNGPSFYATDRSFETGTGLAISFAALLMPDARIAGEEGVQTRQLFMHELIHHWLDPRIYADSDPKGPAHAAWFNEGFANLLTWKLLEETNLATAERTRKKLEGFAARYDENPLKNTPNDEAAPQFFSSRDGHQIAYHRGAIIAAWLAIRLTDHGSSLQIFLRTILERADEGPLDRDALFGVVAELTDEETAAQMRRYAIDGESVPTPARLLVDAEIRSD